MYMYMYTHTHIYIYMISVFFFYVYPQSGWFDTKDDGRFSQSVGPLGCVSLRKSLCRDIGRLGRFAPSRRWEDGAPPGLDSPHEYKFVISTYIYHKPELIQPLISQVNATSIFFFPHPVVFEVKFGRTFHIVDL